ncbi:hypothetical protein E2R68_00620 [Psychromonas sp. RZ22]|uniref:hypothetical protein n=1 Tax=Psychromonas algarum TaxID=2555643 RepID=UPI0010684A72|nr:hypothetical protein [Psychromonas sp. RZ22]TEW56572.1 hypothetical protein E2R68_00620 [Psychromonas sp. RZ22]
MNDTKETTYINKIHDLNKYESQYDLIQRLQLLELEPEIVLPLLIKSKEFQTQIAKLEILLNKNKKKKTLVELNEIYIKSIENYEQIKSMYLDLKVVKYISELNEARFESIINRIDKHKSATILYKENLVLILKCLERQQQLKDKFSKELERVGLTFKLFQMLVLSLSKNDKELYQRVYETVNNDFEVLNIDKNASLELTALNCVRGRRTITNTHESFDKFHSVINHPEIFIFQCLLSTALN